jgi:hypothetical protein
LSNSLGQSAPAERVFAGADKIQFLRRSFDAPGPFAVRENSRSPKQKGRDAISAARPFFLPCGAFRNPDCLILFAVCELRRFRTLERFVLPQTLRRPAPNILAAASFWRLIASPNFWLCHEARRPCHAYFFWLGPFWSIVQRRMQKCCAAGRHAAVACAPFIDRRDDVRTQTEASAMEAQ